MFDIESIDETNGLTRINALNNPYITDTVLIKAMKKASNLQVLRLDGCFHITNKALIKIAKKYPHKLITLKVLSLDNCPKITHKGVEAILKCKYNDLTCISMNGLLMQNPIFLGAACLNLTGLHLSSIHPETLKNIAQYSHKLESLSLLNCTQVTDKDFIPLIENNKDLLDMTQNKHLKYINLSGCTQIGDSSINKVIVHCPNLQILDILNCNVTSKVIKEAVEECQNLKSIYFNCKMDLPTFNEINDTCKNRSIKINIEKATLNRNMSFRKSKKLIPNYMRSLSFRVKKTMHNNSDDSKYTSNTSHKNWLEEHKIPMATVDTNITDAQIQEEKIIEHHISNSKFFI